MSRPIKFRAWLKEWDENAPIKGKMFYDALPIGGWDDWWIVFDGHKKGYDGSWRPGEGIEIMQFTGLTDKNGGGRGRNKQPSRDYRGQVAFK